MLWEDYIDWEDRYGEGPADFSPESDMDPEEMDGADRDEIDRLVERHGAIRFELTEGKPESEEELLKEEQEEIVDRIEDICRTYWYESFTDKARYYLEEATVW